MSVEGDSKSKKGNKEEEDKEESLNGVQVRDFITKDSKKASQKLIFHLAVLILMDFRKKLYRWCNLQRVPPHLLSSSRDVMVAERINRRKLHVKFLLRVFLLICGLGVNIGKNPSKVEPLSLEVEISGAT